MNDSAREPGAPRRTTGALVAAAVGFAAIAIGLVALRVVRGHAVWPWAVVAGGALVFAIALRALRSRRRAASETVVGQWLRKTMGRSRGLDRVATAVGMTEEELRAFTPRYRVARIPKRAGGHRVLHIPDPDTKRLQRRLLRRVFARLRAHPAAHAFERGRSIATQAAQHVGRAVVLHMDVVDFFGTTHAGRIERMLVRLGWDAEAAGLLTRLVTHEGGLPQGAPTSPRLSNLVNTALDYEIAHKITRRHGRYTRYADDVTISFPEDWIGAVQAARSAVSDAFQRRGYRMHERRKLSVRRRHQRQSVCGLVVNRAVALPRETRRLLRAVRHHVATGKPATLTAAQLRGWDAYESMIRAQGADTPPPFSRGRRPTKSWDRYRP